MSVLFIRLLPLDLSAGIWPGPDWILVLGFAWVLRRPNFVPVLLFAMVMFTNDLVLMRAPGLWSGLAVIGLEFLRGRFNLSRELPFLFEWAMVSGVVLAISIANRLILSASSVPQPDISLEMILVFGTAAIYPLVVIASSLVLGVRKIPPGAVDDLGHRV